MKIRTRLILLFTLLTAIILLLFAIGIYVSAKENRETEFYHLLKKEAITKANLFLNAHVDKKVLQDIYHNNRKIISEVEVAIYDTSFDLLYHDAVDIDFVKETKPMIEEINSKGAIAFYQQRWQVIGLRYDFNGHRYIVTAAAFDKYGYSKLHNLLINSIITFVASILLILLAGVFLAKKAFKPVGEMIDKAKAISTTNLDLRLPSTEGKDELTELAATFNKLLDRLEKSFDAQKDFVSNISHELRTPLTAMLAELQLTAGKDLDTRAYKEVIEHVIADTQKLVRLSNSLLDFAKANYDQTEISFSLLRLDELLLDTRSDVLHNHPDYKISLAFEREFDHEAEISVLGNAYLLKVAFANLLENGCKFSVNKACYITILFRGANIVLEFADHGAGIPAEDIAHIFTPFYRAAHTKSAFGHGIGLSLTDRIVGLHKGQIAVQSTVDVGTTFRVTLPHME